MNDFTTDNLVWQLPVRNKFITPFYEQRFGKGNFHHLKDGHVLQKDYHIDTIIVQNCMLRCVDEKIMRRRKDGGNPVNVSCETWTCSVLGKERRGWMYGNFLTTHLLYCFADAQTAEEVTGLDCLIIPFPRLCRWFWEQGEERWPLHVEKEANRTHSRNVPIAEIRKNVGFERIRLPIQGAAQPGIAPHLESGGRRLESVH